MRRACSCSASTFASVDFPTRIGPSTTIWRGGLNVGVVTAGIIANDSKLTAGTAPASHFHFNRDPHHHALATAATILANASTSRVSTTSAGECEYRSGHANATSTDPYLTNAVPSFPPDVTPYCIGIAPARAIFCSFSSAAGGTIFELSTALTTNPFPTSASAYRFDSSGES